MAPPVRLSAVSTPAASAASGSSVTVDTDLAATLDQVLVGLLPADALPAVEVFLDEEGTPIARRSGDTVTAERPVRWRAPADVRATSGDGPVVVAVGGHVPAAALPAGRVVVLPAGGVRPDDARWPAWAAAWSHGAAAVVEVPVPPTVAARRDAALASAYSSGPLTEVPTVAQPAGPGRTVFFTGFSGSGKS